ncbi:hypothetical protein [Oceanicola sp. S124]|uniref:hypothetical protein n=1 Tax=Oceanicola sp. S124 TaxID=1042378 RepID=UPI0002558A1D|nr:hypothetical protein [Oceanicola sp. S124]
MTTLAAPRRLYHYIPVLGWILRDLERDFFGHIGYAALIAVTAMVLAVKTWGLVALGLTALALVPVVFIVLILLTRG